MSIQDYRAQYSQRNGGVDPYADLTDDQLASGLHKKYGGDMPFDEFATKIGVTIDPAAKAARAHALDPVSSPIDNTQSMMSKALDWIDPRKALPAAIENTKRIWQDPSAQDIRTGNADSEDSLVTALGKVPEKLAASAGSKVAGVQRFRANELDAQNKLFESRMAVLPQAISDWKNKPNRWSTKIEDEPRVIEAVDKMNKDMAKKVKAYYMDSWDVPENDPRVVAEIESHKIKPQDFVVPFPSAEEMTPEKKAELYGKFHTDIMRQSQLEDSANEARENTARLSQEGNVSGSQWSAQNLIASGLAATPELGAAAGVTALAGPGAGLAAMGGLIAPQNYDEGEQKYGHEKGVLYSALMTAPEIVTELPFLAMVKGTPAGKAAIKAIAGKYADNMMAKYGVEIGTEAASEGISQLMQDVAKIGVFDEKMTVGDVVNDVAFNAVLGGITAAPIAAPGAIHESKAKRAEKAKAQQEADLAGFNPPDELQPPLKQLGGPAPETVPTDFEVGTEGVARRPGEELPPQPAQQALPAPKPTGQYEVSPEGVTRELSGNEARDLQAARESRQTLGSDNITRIPGSGEKEALSTEPVLNIKTAAGRRALHQKKVETLHDAIKDVVAPEEVTLAKDGDRWTISVRKKPAASFDSEGLARTELAGIREEIKTGKSSISNQPQQTVESKATFPEASSQGSAIVLGQQVERPAQPTPKQAIAGNYKKPPIKWNGLDIKVENVKGSTRSKVDAKGQSWSSLQHADYGYFTGTKSTDGDGVDVYMGPHRGVKTAYVIDQLTPDGLKHDEPKVVIGAKSEDAAKALYLKHYPRGWKGMGAITPVPVEGLKTWLKSGNTTEPMSWQPPKAKEAPKPKRSTKAPQAKHDSILEYLSKLNLYGSGTNGLSIDAIASEGLDRKELSTARGHGINRPFTQSGGSLNHAAEILTEAGYPVNGDKNKLLDLITSEIRTGKKTYAGERSFEELDAELRSKYEDDNADQEEVAALEARVEGAAKQSDDKAEDRGLESKINRLYKEVNSDEPFFNRDNDEEDYRGQHTAPMKEDGAPLHEMTDNGIYPKDFYSSMHEYMAGGDRRDSVALSLISNLHGAPNKLVTVYRAVPYEKNRNEQISELEGQLSKYQRRRIVPDGGITGFKNGSEWYSATREKIEKLQAMPDDSGIKKKRIGINKGDWVTITRSYAKEHGDSNLNGNYKIISKEVAARDLFTDGNSIQEWGYDPQPYDFHSSAQGLVRAGKTGALRFKSWFDGSVVVNEDGSPKLVYHGTPDSSFEKFRDEPYFTEDKAVAGLYTSTSASSINSKPKEGRAPGVISAYLSIKRPFDTRIKGNRDLFNSRFLGKRGNGTALADSGLPDWLEARDLAEWIQEEKLPFDGLILDEGGVPDGNGGVKKRGISYVPMKGNQAVIVEKNVSDIPQFQRDVKKTPELVIQHNLSGENLLHAAKMGGIAVPSLAITKKDQSITGFGDITLIGHKEMADPKGYARTQVYGADVYSPRYPEVTHKVTSESLGKLNEKLSKFTELFGDGKLSRDDLEKDPAHKLKHNRAVVASFLESKGIEPKIVYEKLSAAQKRDIASLKRSPLKKYLDSDNPLALSHDDEFSRLAVKETNKQYKESGIENEVGDFLTSLNDPDSYGTRDRNARSYVSIIERYQAFKKAPPVSKSGTEDAMREQVSKAKLGPELEEYAGNLVASLNADEKIFTGFTPMGSKKYVPHTLDNVIRMLKKDIRGGEGFNYGVGSLRSKYAPQFRSVKDIVGAKDKLLSNSDFERVKEEVDAKFWEIANKPAFRSGDQLIGVMEDMAKMPLDRALKESGVDPSDVSDDTKAEIMEFVGQLRNMPTEYFEAKITRPVALSEFSHAVVPDNTTTKVLDVLKANGVDFSTYKKGDETDRRRVVADVAAKKDALFQKSAESGSKLTERQVRGVINQMLRNFKTRPKLFVVQSYDQLPVNLLKAIDKRSQNEGYGSGTTPQVRGVYWRGGVYVVADHVASVDRLRKTVLHEAIVHHGLDVVMDRETKNAILDGLIRDNESDVNARGILEYGKPTYNKDGSVKTGYDSSNQRQQRLAAEEMLAYYGMEYLSDNPVPEVVKPWIVRVIDAIKDFVKRIFGINKSYDLPKSFDKQFVDKLMRDLFTSLRAGERLTTTDTEDQPMFHRNPEAMERATIRPGTPEAHGYAGVANRVIDVWNKKIGWRYGALGNLPEAKEYLVARYKTLGGLSHVRDVSRQIFDTLSKASEADSKHVYDYLTTAGADAAPIVDEKVRSMAQHVKQLIDDQGQALVQAGLLSEESYESYRDQYLPRLYLRHILEDAGKGKAMGTGKKLSDLGYLKKRKDIPEEVRKVILGEITDPAFLAAFGVSRTMRDLNMMNFLNIVSQNRSWVPDKMLVDFDGRQVSPYWLHSEAKQLRKQADYIKNRTISTKARAIADRMDSMGNAAIEAMGGTDLTDYKQIPDSPRYGSLRGLYVRKEIHEDLVGAYNYVDADSFLDKVFGQGGAVTKLTQGWKMSKVALNAPSHFRNMMGNAMMMHLSGVNMAMLPVRVVQSINSIIDKDSVYQTAVKYGMKEATFANSELYRIRDEWIMLQKAEKPILNKLKAMWSVGIDKLGDIYQFEEALFKIAKLHDELAKGTGAADAMIEAHKWLFDYSLVPRWVRYLRNAPMGIPFLSYSYLVLPRLTETAVRKPWKYLPYLMVGWALTEAIKNMFGASDDDLDKLKKAYPQWMQDRGGMMLLPNQDQHGRWQVTDMGYTVPWGQLMDISSQLQQGHVGEAADSMGLLSGPVPDVISAFKTNVDSFTNKPIINPGDPPWQKTQAAISYAANMALPGFVTDKGALGKIRDAYSGKVDPRSGDPTLTKTQAWLRLFGVSIYPIDPEATREKNLRFMQFEIQEVRKRLGNQLKDLNLTDHDKEDIRRIYSEEIKRRVEMYRQYENDSRVPVSLRSNKEKKGDDLVNRTGWLIDGKGKEESVQALRDAGHTALAALFNDMPAKPKQSAQQALEKARLSA